MSTDISRGPRICPSCGNENSPTAGRCWLCFTPLAGAFQAAPAPALAEVRLQPPTRVEKPGFSAGQITAIVLMLICVLIGLATYGLGFWLLVVLAPVLILLAWPGRRPTPDGYLPAMTGCGVVAAVLLVVVSSIITFVDVCFPIGFAGAMFGGFQEYGPSEPPGSYIMQAAWPIGLLVAGVVAWLLVRRFWPRGGRR